MRVEEAARLHISFSRWTFSCLILKSVIWTTVHNTIGAAARWVSQRAQPTLRLRLLKSESKK
jgi:hypothetical protein